MDRRNFFKIVGTASGELLTGACGKQARELIPILVPVEQIIPGVEEWHPSVCRQCAAGCGTIVRVMEAERIVEVDGAKARQKIAAIKKIEGNPLDPVSGGRLCARGQAAVQSLYHPDRLKGPRKRSGPRGEAQFSDIGWEEAFRQASELFQKAVEKAPSRIVFLARSVVGSRAAMAAKFLASIGAPPPSTTGVCDFAVERSAARVAFGWDGVPVYDIQNSDYVLGLGADFLGGWVSPVFYSRRYGHMRQGRPGRRGRLVQAEARFSLTAGSADRWLPVRPGGEHALALAIGAVLVMENLTRQHGPELARLRNSFASVNPERAAAASGISLEQIRTVARELAESEAAVVVAGASIPQVNSHDAVLAASALNWLLGSVGRPGGVMAPAAPPGEAGQPGYGGLLQRLEEAELIVLDGANPAYEIPASRNFLARAPAVISFSPFVDDSSACADLILPDHDPLESGELVVPVVSPVTALNGGRPFVRPLHDTRSTAETLAEIAGRLGRKIEIETPAEVFRKLAPEPENREAFAREQESRGGYWAPASAVPAAKPPASVPPLAEPQLEGSPQSFPLHFQPYPSPHFGDGGTAHLPWIQELPDPVSSAMWELPVEIDPKTAARLGVRNGDPVRVISPRGELTAPAYVNPAAIPGVVSMAIGQGHIHFGRYASGRGANPLTIAAPVRERITGVFAFGATRVRVERAGGRRRLVQFSMMDREPELRRR